MLEQQLAALTVDLVAKGWDKLKEQIGDVQDWMRIADKGVRTLSGGLGGLANSENILGRIKTALSSVVETYRKHQSGQDDFFAALNAGGSKQLQEMRNSNFGRIKSGLAAIADFSARTFGPAIEKATTKLKGFGITGERASQAAKVAFVGATAGLLGFIRAGLQGTMQGEALTYRMQILSREIAAVFLPTIEKLIGYLSQAVRWFQGLSREEQDNVRRNILIGIAILGVVANLSKLVTAVKFATNALSAMYANPVLAGLALLAAALAAVSINAWRMQQNLDAARAETAKVQHGIVKKSEWEKLKKHPAIAGVDDREQRRKLIDVQIEGEQNQIGILAQHHRNRFERGVHNLGAFFHGSLEKDKLELERHRKNLAMLQQLKKTEETGVEPKFEKENDRRMMARSVNFGQWQAFRQAHEIGQARVNEEEAKKMFGQGPSVEEKQLNVLGEIRDNTAKMRPPVA